jgi:hypothetical protein
MAVSHEMGMQFLFHHSGWRLFSLGSRTVRTCTGVRTSRSSKGPLRLVKAPGVANVMAPLGRNPFPDKSLLLDDDDLNQTQLGDKSRYIYARTGDHLMVPFQCDLCHFRNVMDQDPWGTQGGRTTKY